MVAVALVSIPLAGYKARWLKPRHDYFLSRLEYHARREEEAVRLERAYTKMVEHAERAGLLGDRLRRDREQVSQGVEYHSAMARKYRRAARYPWLPVEPDPSEPDWMPTYVHYTRLAANDGNGKP
jgi:hypothetical protein